MPDIWRQQENQDLMAQRANLMVDSAQTDPGPEYDTRSQQFPLGIAQGSAPPSESSRFGELLTGSE